MTKKLLNNPWFYFLLSLIHQCLVIAPGEFPHLFPDSQGYFDWNPQRMPVYPALLKLLGLRGTAILQIVMVALAAAALYRICRKVIEKLALPRCTDLFVWIGSLYFATNFELIQYSPTILTESLGISFFIFYFFSILQWLESRQTSKMYFTLSFLIFPLILVFLRPSFILVPAALSFFLALWFLREKSTRKFTAILLCLVAYLGSIQIYAYWNRTRLGHVGISDIAQHQILANYMARGVLMEEAFKPEASPGLRSFGEAYAITKQDPTLKDSQYSLFEQWAKMNPGKELYSELIMVNKELLRKRPFAYLMASIHNLSTLIDGRASFNYYNLRDRDVLSKIYFWLQFVLDNIFCVFWFIALIYYFVKFRTWKLFSLENLIFVTVATQFLTIGFIGYSELRRQSIGVASVQMLFVLVMWAHLLKACWEKKGHRQLQ